jgi:hypothetical protein
LNSLSFGNPDLTWQHYGIQQSPILFNGAKTHYKAVIRNNEIVSIVSEAYKLLPNEEAVKLANEAAAMAGLVPFHEFSGEWFVRMDRHVILDRDGRRVHALYAIDKSFDVGGEKMHLGVGVHNSIDGSTGFGCGIFTFRHACANMVWAGMRGYEQAFDERKTIEYIYKRHTKGLETFMGGLKTAILTVMDKANIILETYQQLAETEVTREFLNKLRRSRLPNKVLPNYIVKPEESTVNPADLTQWQVYNDITAAIWHNAKSGLKTKDFQFKTLHAIILPSIS